MEEVKLSGLEKVQMGDFESLVVLEFAVNVKRAAIEWVMAKLQASSDSNGADLQVKAMVMQHNQVNYGNFSF